MTGPAELLFPFLWNLLPQRRRERLSAAILALQSRTGIQVPISDTVVFAREESHRKQFEHSLFRGAPAGKPSLPPYSLLSTCYNEKKTIGRWLDSIASQTHAPREVIVVDGGSRDGTPRAIEEWRKAREGKLGFELVVIAEGRKNISQGRNRAALEAREGILAFTDAGCELDRFWAERILEPFAADNRIEVSMGWYRPIIGSRFAAALTRFLLPQLEAVDPATFLPSARSLALRKEAFRRTGGYPEFLSFAGEDSLFDYYLKSDAEKFAFVPEALVFWRYPENLAVLWRTIANYARGDAEGGKLFWLYYSNLLREASKLALELVLLFCVIGLNTLLGLKFLGWAALGLALFMAVRSFGLILKYRPLDKGGLFSSEGFFSVLAVKFLIAAQVFGFSRGLLGRESVERRRRKCADAGTAVVIVPTALLRGDQDTVMDTIRRLLDARRYVTVIYQSVPKRDAVVFFEHQFLESYLRSAFQFENWWEREKTFPAGSRIAVDLVSDSLSRGLVDQLTALGYESRSPASCL